jgi:GPH family glycoside/pentoside/hexuronide:cation symporter
VSTSPARPASADRDRLKPQEYIGYALGDTASNFFFQTFNIFLTYYYVDVWGIPATVLLWMIPLVRAFGVFDDVIMGLIADRTNTRWGKFRPYLLFGAIPYGLCGYLMFAGPHFGPTGKIVYACWAIPILAVSGRRASPTRTGCSG